MLSSYHRQRPWSPEPHWTLTASESSKTSNKTAISQSVLTLLLAKATTTLLSNQRYMSYSLLSLSSLLDTQTYTRLLSTLLRLGATLQYHFLASFCPYSEPSRNGCGNFKCDNNLKQNNKELVHCDHIVTLCSRRLLLIPGREANGSGPPQGPLESC